jgi:hypothetical protein
VTDALGATADSGSVNVTLTYTGSP